MAARTTIISSLFLFVVLSLAVPIPIVPTQEGDIKYDLAFNFTVPATILRDVAYLTINHTAHVVVCFQERFPIPNASHFSNETCTFFYNFSSAANTDSAQVPLRNLDYHVGVYFASSAITAENTTHVSLSLTGENCTAHMYWDPLSANCRQAVPIAIGNTSHSVVFPSASTKFFELTIPNLVGSITVRLGADEAEKPVFIRLRWEGSPSAAYHDADDSLGKAYYVSPRPGVWVIGFEAHEAANYTFFVSTEECAGHPGFAGAGCVTPYHPAADNMTLVAYPGVYQYWKFVASSTATLDLPLRVSVTTVDHKHLPYLFVSRGNLPSAGNADILNCNQGYCDVINSIHVNSTAGATEEWFIGVTASVTEGNTTFGIWFNSTCVPECETDNHGSCQADGTCYCQIDFTGIDCSLSDGLGAQYIVLIIIASLVVASAIIGFVAWAYMRRKRSTYDLVD